MSTLLQSRTKQQFFESGYRTVNKVKDICLFTANKDIKDEIFYHIERLNDLVEKIGHELKS